MDRLTLFDLIYALAAVGGREELLFGDCAEGMREAFLRSLTPTAFPELWFELPLAGAPWCDLHALVSYTDLAGSDATFAGHGGAYADALTWFVGQEPRTVRQLAMSYDVSWVVTAVIFIIYYLRGHWLTRCKNRQSIGNHA